MMMMMTTMMMMIIIIIIIIIIIKNKNKKKTKVKVSPLQGMKAHEGCGCKGPHIHNHGTRRGRVASLMLGHLYPRYSFYRRLSGAQDQSGHEGVKKISTPPTPGIELGPSGP